MYVNGNIDKYNKLLNKFNKITNALKAQGITISDSDNDDQQLSEKQSSEKQLDLQLDKFRYTKKLIT